MSTAALVFRPEATAPDARWAALDEPAERDSFSRLLPGDAGHWESYLAVDGMVCAACSLTVEAALLRVPGVHDVQVNGASGTARVVWSAAATRPSEWLVALKKAGYDALPAGDLLNAAPRRHAERALLWRWLVAGFCMMQVMMYAAPAYLATPGDITARDQGLMRWASWVLTLPVILFSCRPFFGSAWRDLRNRRIGMDVPVALGILIAFAASSAATFDPAGTLGAEVWFDSVTMFVFFLLSGRLLEQRLRERTAGALEALMRRLPDSVERQRPDASFERVPLRRLAVGDLLRVLPGEVIPADGRVSGGSSRVDEALLTGESRPLERSCGDTVVAGSHNLQAPLLVRVERLGADTRYAGIVALMEQASVQKPRLARVADRIAGPFLVLVLLAAVAAGAWWWSSGPAHAIGVAVAVLIVTCPCALSLATPAATLAAAGALARRGVLVRNLSALEAGATVDTVVFDKTGTLTDAHIAARLTAVRPRCEPRTALMLAGTLARQSLHPVSRAVALVAGDSQAGMTTVRDVVEYAGRGVQATVQLRNGEPRVIRLGSAKFCAPHTRDTSGRVYLADALGWLATFSLDETLRPDAASAVKSLKALGLNIQLLSGDQPHAVAHLARRADIDQAFAACSPEHKLKHLHRLQHARQTVAMVGDGLNDGPVLACADVSIAMGNAVPLAQARSDFIVQGGQLGAVPALLSQARRLRRIVRQNLAWAALYNAVCVPLAVAGAMPPWLAGLGMAASSLLVVANSARLSRSPPASASA